MKFHLTVGLILLLLLPGFTVNAQFIVPDMLIINSDSSAFIKGADVSFIPQIEDFGGVYKENDIPQDPLKIFKDHGFNYIR